MKRVYNSAQTNGCRLALILVAAQTMLAAAPSKPQLDNLYGKLPLNFEENQGQSDPQVRFQSKGPGYSLFLTDDQAVFVFGKNRTKNVVRMRLEGARKGLHVSSEDRLPGTANYFIGNDSAEWHGAVPTYRKVKYSSVYDGVDLFYYGNQRQLEYDFVVAPNANAKQIRLQFDGAQRVGVERNGDLRIVERGGEVAFHKPVVYQELSGQRRRKCLRQQAKCDGIGADFLDLSWRQRRGYCWRNCRGFGK